MAVGGKTASYSPEQTAAGARQGQLSSSLAELLPQFEGLVPGFQEISGDLSRLVPGFEGLSAGAAGTAPAFEEMAARAGGLAPGFQNISDLLVAQGKGLAGTGATLLDPLISGRLPPGAQSQVDLSTQNAINAIKAKYGSLGLSGSTMEADSIGNVLQEKSAQQFSIAEQMANQALQAMGLSTGAYGGAASALGGAGGALGTAGGLLGGATGAFGTAGSIQGGATSALGGAAGALGGATSALGGGVGALGGASSAAGSQASIYSNLSQQQFKEDTYLTDTIAKFATAIGSAAGKRG